MERILAEDRTFSLILSDENLLGRILTDDRVISRIVKSDKNFNKLLEFLLADKNFLFKLFNDREFSNRISSQKNFLSKMLSNESFLSAVLSDERIFGKMVSDGNWLDKYYGKVLGENNKIHLKFLKSIIEFQSLWKNLNKYIDVKSDCMQSKLHEVVVGLRNSPSVEDALLDFLCQGQVIKLGNAVLKFLDRRALWILIKEILIEEEYFFETETNSPTILDC